MIRVLGFQEKSHKKKEANKRSGSRYQKEGPKIENKIKNIVIFKNKKLSKSIISFLLFSINIKIF